MPVQLASSPSNCSAPDWVREANACWASTAWMNVTRSAVRMAMRASGVVVGARPVTGQTIHRHAAAEFLVPGRGRANRSGRSSATCVKIVL